MKIGGLLKFSLIDYPGKVAAVVFTQGCNFRCPYCHNAELVRPENFREPIAEGDVLDFLAKRVGQLEGVVVTGGEPTLQKDLISFLGKLKDLGYAVKLDSNGSQPEVLQEVMRLGLVDFIAMDVKAPLEKYMQFTDLTDCTRCIRESIRIILDSGVAHEFRTTVAPPLVPEEDIPRIVSLITGTNNYKLQRFIPRDNILNTELLANSPVNFSEEEIAGFQGVWGISGS